LGLIIVIIKSIKELTRFVKERLGNTTDFYSHHSVLRNDCVKITEFNRVMGCDYAGGFYILVVATQDSIFVQSLQVVRGKYYYYST